MPWKWNPMKNHYQQTPYPESENVSAQIKAPEIWKVKKNPPIEPMEVEEGSITFPSEK